MAVDLDALATELLAAGFDVSSHSRDSMLVFDPRRGHELQAALVRSDGHVMEDEPDHPALDLIRRHIEGQGR